MHRNNLCGIVVDCEESNALSLNLSRRWCKKLFLIVVVRQ